MTTQTPPPLLTRNKSTLQARSHARGFSLVEVLVSIVILSFGILGMVGLQAAALQANREARLQSVASALARELAEMMRGNKAIGLLTGAANPYLGDFSNDDGSTPLVPTTTAYCLSVASAAVCADLTAVANAQMTDWLARVDAALPGARVVVCVDDAPFVSASGQPRWACTAATGANTMIKIGWTRASTNRGNTGAAAFVRAAAPSLILPVTPGTA